MPFRAHEMDPVAAQVGQTGGEMPLIRQRIRAADVVEWQIDCILSLSTAT